MSDEARSGGARAAGMRTLLIRAIYAIGLIGAVAWVVLVLEAAAGSGTLGYDFRAYDLAVDRLIAGQPLYDPNAQSMGDFGLFFYPPPFALLVAPFALLPAETAVWAWTVFLIAATVAAVALMPISARARLAVLLLAALSWPVLYSIKLGQVGPILLLLFVIGWRWMERPWVLGASAALGAAIKIQPGLMLAWTLLTGRLKATVVGFVLLAALAVAGALAAGQGAYFDLFALLGRVNEPILTPHTVGVGRILYESGAAETVATVANVANLAAVAAVTLFAILRASSVASYLAVAVASHFISPILWEHYAFVLLLPTAWLIDRGRWWAALIPLATSTLPDIAEAAGLQLDIPLAVYPVAFWVALLTVTWEGLRERRIANTPVEDAPGRSLEPTGAA
jgi:hypothetical protein